MDRYKLTIARFPGGNSEHPDSSGYVMDLLMQLPQDPRIASVTPWRKSDTPVTMCRNKCVKDALAAGCDYLLMIDSDMCPDCEPGAPFFWPTAWEFMMERRAREKEYEATATKDNHPALDAKYQSETYFPPATIAAPYCGPPPWEKCYVFKWQNFTSGDPDVNFKLEMIDRDDAASRTGIQEVAALPTGLILYDMRVFKKLPPPWFDYEWADEPYRTMKASTEDVFQTRNASIMGLPQYVAWDCWAGHHKNKLVMKPTPLTIKAIREEYRDAILRSQGKL